MISLVRPLMREAGGVLEPDDVRTAAEWAALRFAGLPSDAWDEPAPHWTRRRTLDHVVDALAFYGAYVGTRARERLAPPRDGDRDATPAALVRQMRAAADRFTALLAGMADAERAFHPSGMADCAGWIGMACTELLVHTWDATRAEDGADDDGGQEGFGQMAGLASRVVARVLPWAPPGDGWARLLQATGRAPLGDAPPAGADWWWQSAPLGEWDGRPRRRTAPPQW